jgi:DNA-directed RNA polymerase specialized sigma24 family protein
VAEPTDQQIRELLLHDADAGWRAFVDRYTPTLLALIERAGIRDYDEAMELYLRTCERLSADGYSRLRRHDPAKGPLAAWLAVVVRNVTVDWVRSRAGRRRLFKAVDLLPARERQVFELYYWDDKTPSEICEILAMRESAIVTLSDVFAAMDAIDAVLSDRHRRDLLAMAVRSRTPLSLEGELESGAAEPADPSSSADASVRARELAASLNDALASLDPEEAAIARLKYVQGLSNRDIQAALHIERLSDERVRSISMRLRAWLIATACVLLAGLLNGAPL